MRSNTAIKNGPHGGERAMFKLQQPTNIPRVAAKFSPFRRDTKPFVKQIMAHPPAAYLIVTRLIIPISKRMKDGFR
jgi:hypothetical protein